MVMGWYESYKSIGFDKCAFGFCTFLDGTKFITMEEHHERMMNGEDFCLGVFNMFCNSYACTMGTPKDNAGVFRIWSPKMDAIHLKRVYDHVTNIFPLSIKVGLEKDPDMMNKVQAHLKIKLQGDELDFMAKKQFTLN